MTPTPTCRSYHGSLENDMTRRIYYVNDESGHVERYRSTSAELAARRYVMAGPRPTEPGTHVHIVNVRPAGEERGHPEMVVREVPLRPCSGRRDGVHRWRHVAAYGGENGGVYCEDRCAGCGWTRHHETRGQCRATGQVVPGGVTTYREPRSSSSRCSWWVTRDGWRWLPCGR